MATRQSSDSKRLISCSITIDPALLEQSDQRARDMDLTRSQYFRRLVRTDLAQGAMSLQETPPHPIH